jgi:hypothetical protein
MQSDNTLVLTPGWSTIVLSNSKLGEHHFVFMGELMLPVPCGGLLALAQALWRAP